MIDHQSFVKARVTQLFDVGERYVEHALSNDGMVRRL